MKMKEDMRPGDLRVSNLNKWVVCRKIQNPFAPPICVWGALILLAHFGEQTTVSAAADPWSPRRLSWKVLTNRGVMFTTLDQLETKTSENK
jgi:hypothetical protein